MHGLGVYALALAGPAGPTGEPGDIVGSDVAAEATDSGALALASAAQTLRMHTWWASTTWTPDTSGDTTGECWGGGGGSITNDRGGGGGAYARDDVFTRTSGVGIAITIGAPGAAGGGTGGTTSIGSTCVAVGAVGNAGGLAASCTGDVTRSGTDGVISATGSGGAAPGSSTAASGTTPGESDGGRGGTGGGNSSARIPGGGARAGASFQGPGEQGLARATYHEPADGVTPPLDNMTHQRTGSGTSHPVTIPDGPGNTVVYVIMTDGAPTIGLDSGSPTTVLTATNGSACKLQVMTHAVSGAPTAVTTSNTEATQIWAFRVSDLTVITGTGTNATGTNADPPSHDMGSSAPTLWVTGMCFDSEPNDMITGGPPSGYTDSHYGSSAVNSGGVEGMIAWRVSTGQIENPETFTNESGEHCSFTLGMR